MTNLLLFRLYIPNNSLIRDYILQQKNLQIIVSRLKCSIAGKIQGSTLQYITIEYKACCLEKIYEKV